MAVVLVTYVADDEETQTIARRVSDRLRVLGHEITDHAIACTEQMPDMALFDGLIVVGPVGTDQNTETLDRFVSENRGQLDALPNLFVSINPVSTPDGSPDIALFEARTGWHPDRVYCATGAGTPRAPFLMRVIERAVRARGTNEAETSQTDDNADRDALHEVIDSFSTHLPGPAPAIAAAAE